MIYTDHKNLEYFTTRRLLSKRQLRWSETLGNFAFTLVFRKGSQNGRADALSRQEDDTADSDVGILIQQPYVVRTAMMLSPVQLIATHDLEIETRTRAAIQNDPEIMQLIDAIERNDQTEDLSDYTLVNGLLYRNERLWIPNDEQLKTDLLTQHHDTEVAGHPGRLRTYDLVRRNYYWPSMRAFVNRFVHSCATCQRAKVPRRLPYGTLQSLAVPERPWLSITMDLITDLPPTDQYMIVPKLGAAFEAKTVELDSLRPLEVLVEIKATGICHTDIAVQQGKIPMKFPAVLGHEGSGVVRAVGSGVRDFQAVAVNHFQVLEMNQ
ncbi:hypothetical protein V1522DRAFT_250411 [Lipomyces starkeyi]